MKRSLTLKRDALSALTDDDLGGVVGGVPYSGDAITCPLMTCVSRQITCYRCI